ncbi:hypothetical protein JZU68_06170, partial [bacterium]|nr:hypothetical protein [bacterium]
LKPHQTGSLLLIQNTKSPEFLRFEIDELSKELYSNILYDNERYDDGNYKVVIDIYGRKGNETQYRKRSFAVFVDFKCGQFAEIGGCFSI